MVIEKCTQATRDKLKVLDSDPAYEVRTRFVPSSPTRVWYRSLVRPYNQPAFQQCCFCILSTTASPTPGPCVLVDYPLLLLSGPQVEGGLLDDGRQAFCCRPRAPQGGL